LRPHTASYPGVKRQGRETDNVLPSSADVPRMWSYTSTPQHSSRRGNQAEGHLYFTLSYRPTRPAHHNVLNGHLCTALSEHHALMLLIWSANASLQCAQD
jgi:hypothetical protein